MARRVLIAILVVALGVLGAVWFAEGAFTVSRSVRVEPPMTIYDDMPVLADGAEMRIKCSPTWAYYVTERGEPMFFNHSTGSPEDPRPLCDAALSQRRLTAVGFVVIGLVGGAAVLVLGRVRDRLAAELVVRPVDIGDKVGVAAESVGEDRATGHTTVEEAR